MADRTQDTVDCSCQGAAVDSDCPQHGQYSEQGEIHRELSDFKRGDRVTDKETRTMNGIVVEPELPITVRNVGQGHILIKWDHLPNPQPERAVLLMHV